MSRRALPLGVFEETFFALQAGVVPRARDLSPDEKRESLRIVGVVFERKSPRTRLAFGAFVCFVELVSLARFGHRPARLFPREMESLLFWFFDHRWALLRKGFLGLSMVAKASVFGQKRVHESIRFRLKDYEGVPNVAHRP